MVIFLGTALAILAVSPVSASITCLKVGTAATAKWTNAADKNCTWTGIVGSNFGIDPVNEGNYACNGRCGADCTGAALGNVYTQDCFSHDICSFFNNASGGASDPNCGGAFDAAIDDTAFGFAYGCSQTNPTNPVVAPTTTPACG